MQSVNDRFVATMTNVVAWEEAPAGTGKEICSDTSIQARAACTHCQTPHVAMSLRAQPQLLSRSFHTCPAVHCRSSSRCLPAAIARQCYAGHAGGACLDAAVPATGTGGPGQPGNAGGAEFDGAPLPGPAGDRLRPLELRRRQQAAGGAGAALICAESGGGSLACTGIL